MSLLMQLSFSVREGDHVVEIRKDWQTGSVYLHGPDGARIFIPSLAFLQSFIQKANLLINSTATS